MADDVQKSIVLDFTYTTDTYDLFTQAEVYGKVITKMAEADKNIVVLTSDMTRSNKTGDFKKTFPERFFNFGIAEANMFAASAGMATCGKIPFVTTFAVFASLRCAEMIRTDIAYPNLPVRIIATHAGLSQGNGGTTHHSTEDIAILRSMANMTVIVPADSIETGKAVAATAKLPGPVYIRIGRALEPMAYPDDSYDYTIGKAVVMRDYGKDAAVIACGVAVKAACDAADELKDNGIKIRVINMHTIKPLDVDTLMKAAADTGKIITAEEHSTVGGLAGAVSEALTEAGVAVKFKKLGVPDIFSAIGYPDELYARYKINKDGIAETVKSIVS